jgi:hypothetical protein
VTKSCQGSLSSVSHVLFKRLPVTNCNDVSEMLRAVTETELHFGTESFVSPFAIRKHKD